MPIDPRLLGRRDFAKLGFGAAALATAATIPGLRHAYAAAMDATSDMNALVAAAKKEGTLNAIALPRDWANYGALMDTFTQKYGIKINDANPDGSSAQEMQAIRSLKGQDRRAGCRRCRPVFHNRGRAEKAFRTV